MHIAFLIIKLIELSINQWTDYMKRDARILTSFFI